MSASADPSATPAAGTAAVSVARAIEREIAAAGWPVGELLGSEKELCNRFGVGRGVMREAARILEVRGAALRRRGPGGGLIVDRPDPALLASAAQLFLDYRGVTTSQLYRVWAALEVVAVQEVIDSLDETAIARLRGLVREPPPPTPTVRVDSLPDLHGEIARLCPNPAVGLFLAVIVSLCKEYGYEEMSARAAHWAHRSYVDMVDAVTSGDVALAQFLVRRFISRLAEMQAMRVERERLVQDTDLVIDVDR
jgi:DNA-binding FadR family transcriptional regulator